MRKNLLFALVALVAIGAVAGERFYNRLSGAQDIPLPKAPETEKKDLFELLKKDLEAKKEPAAPSTLPALHSAKDDKLPIFPSGKDDKPLFPAPVETPKPADVLVPPSLPAVTDKTPPPVQTKVIEPKTELQLPSFGKKDADLPPPMPLTTEEKYLDARKLVLPSNGPPAVNKSDDKPLPTVSDKKDPLASFPPLPGKEPSKSEPTKLIEKNVLPQGFNAGKYPAEMEPIQPSSAPKAVTLPKNSPWSLNVVMVDGQTIVTAVVNKKHEFKILCQTLDLQTGKGTLKASGKVHISGDALNGTCDHLSITLLEDRLLLEGGVHLSTDRSSSNVSETRPATFELKGETLNLRISELQTAQSDVWQNTYPRVDGIRMARGDSQNRVVTASMKLEGTQWTPYGRLRQVKSNDNTTTMWSLEGNEGAVIAYLLAREGGTLDQYVGRNISVYGTREREQSGHPVLRVTHIAVP